MPSVAVPWAHQALRAPSDMLFLKEYSVPPLPLYSSPICFFFGSFQGTLVLDVSSILTTLILLPLVCSASECLCGFSPCGWCSCLSSKCLSFFLLSSEILYLSPPDLSACLAAGHLLYFCSPLPSSSPCPTRLLWLVKVWSACACSRGFWDTHIPRAVFCGMN